MDDLGYYGDMYAHGVCRPFGDQWVTYVYSGTYYGDMYAHGVCGPFGDQWVTFVYSGTLYFMGTCIHMVYVDPLVTNG